MSKTLNWDSHQKLPFSVNPGGKLGSKELMLKAQANTAKQEEIQTFMQKAGPALAALLKCRLGSGSPITVMRAFPYMSNELVKSDHSEYFKDIQKIISPGTQLILKSLDPNLQEFIFEDQNHKEVVLPYVAQEQLMTNTDIYESVINFIKQKELGE